MLGAYLLLHAIDGFGLSLADTVLLHEGAVEAVLQLQFDLSFVQVSKSTDDGLQQEHEQQYEGVLEWERAKKANGLRLKCG